MTYKEIRANEEVNALLDKGNKNLGLLGFTDHSQAHCIHVADTAGHILKKFGYDAHDIELAKIAGYMHDIGNAVNRAHQLSTAACLLMKFCVAATFLRKTASRSSRPSPTTMNRRAARWTQSRRHSSSPTRPTSAAAGYARSPRLRLTFTTGSTTPSPTRH